MGEQLLCWTVWLWCVVFRETKQLFFFMWHREPRPNWQSQKGGLKALYKCFPTNSKLFLDKFIIIIFQPPSTQFYPSLLSSGGEGEAAYAAYLIWAAYLPRDSREGHRWVERVCPSLPSQMQMRGIILLLRSCQKCLFRNIYAAKGDLRSQILFWKLIFFSS